MTNADGTGIVHQAPAFGEDDHRVAIAHEVIRPDELPPCPIDDVGRFIMGGKTADELMELKNNDQDDELVAQFEAANCRKLQFRCRAKMDTFGDEQR